MHLKCRHTPFFYLPSNFFPGSAKFTFFCWTEKRSTCSWKICYPNSHCKVGWLSKVTSLLVNLTGTYYNTYYHYTDVFDGHITRKINHVNLYLSEHNLSLQCFEVYSAVLIAFTFRRSKWKLVMEEAIGRGQCTKEKGKTSLYWRLDAMNTALTRLSWEFCGKPCTVHTSLPAHMRSE